MTTALNQLMKGNTDHFYIHNIIALKPNHIEVQELKEAGHLPLEFGSRIWRSSYLLIEYLSRFSFQPEDQIVELGCGWGLPSTYLKKTFNSNVIATDFDQNVEVYQQLISSINDVNVDFERHSFSHLGKQTLKDINYLVGADICYSTSNANKLYELFVNYMNQTDGHIILSDSGRAPFFKLVDRLATLLPVTVKKITLKRPTRLTGYVLYIGKTS